MVGRGSGGGEGGGDGAGEGRGWERGDSGREDEMFGAAPGDARGVRGGAGGVDIGVGRSSGVSFQAGGGDGSKKGGGGSSGWFPKP